MCSVGFTQKHSGLLQQGGVEGGAEPKEQRSNSNNEGQASHATQTVGIDCRVRYESEIRQQSSHILPHTVKYVF